MTELLLLMLVNLAGAKHHRPGIQDSLFDKLRGGSWTQKRVVDLARFGTHEVFRRH
jgi:hypothetical protein